MTTKRQQIKEQLVAALSHPEAEDGLYFENLYILHEEEERPAVSGSQVEILDALKELIDEGKVVADDSGEHPVFSAKK